ARVGDTLIRGESSERTRHVELAAPVTIPFTHKSREQSLTLPAGYYGLFATDLRGAYFRTFNTVKVGEQTVIGGLYVENNSSSLAGAFWRGNLTQIEVEHVFFFVPADRQIGVNVVETGTDIPAPGTLRRELVFNGLSQGTLHLMYREFTADGLARPAFYAAVDVDYRPGMLFRYQSVALRIHDATPQSIEYTIEHGFDAQ
ncbi:MAG TPA: hypothetical protein VIR56_02440, partial [Solimonas sp.]